MHLISSNKTFGYFFSLVFLILSVILFFFKSEIFFIFLILFILFIFISYFVPDILTPLNKLWELFGKLIHLIVSNILVTLIYYVVFTLIGLPMRLFGFDPFKKKNFIKVNSHWIKRKKQPNTFIDLF